MATVDHSQWIREQIQDLTVLEINTIIKDDITARPVGNLAEALFAIYDDYQDNLARIDKIHAQHSWLAKPVAAPPVLDQAAVEMALQRLAEFRSITTGTAPTERAVFQAGRLQKLEPSTWACMSRAAAAYLALAPAPAESAAIDPPGSNGLSKRDRLIVKRILGNSAELCQVLDRLKAYLTASKTLQPPVVFELDRTRPEITASVLGHASPMDQARIRKIRDIGTEEVVAQSRIHLDGDIVTRVSRSLFDQKDDHRDAILEVHREGVGRSVDCWGRLVHLGVDILKSIASVVRT